MCGRLYFPMFLFRVGLLTLMNMASWMVLAILFSSSLPRILKLSIDVIWLNIFPYRPDEVAMLGCESLSTTN